MRFVATLLAAVGCAVAVGACGTEAVSVPKDSPNYSGAVIFREHCSGCHSLSVVGAEGSAAGISNRVKTNGPNFNFRKEEVNNVLYAIRNGGFSGAIMPQNIVTGKQAQEVAEFLSAYAGKDAPKVPTTNIPQ